MHLIQRLCISYKDHVTKKEVCLQIQHAIGPHEDFLIFGKKCKLKWYDRVPHSSGLTKTILQVTVGGEEDRADRGEDGRSTASSNGRAYRSPGP